MTEIPKGIKDLELVTSLICMKTDQWEVAKTEGGEFRRALTGEDLYKLLQPHIMAVLVLPYTEGTRVIVNMVRSIPATPKENSLEQKTEP